MITPMNPPTDREREALTILQEECAEVIKEASKVMRFGWDSYHPQDPTTTNRTLLEKEVGDLREIIDTMGSHAFRMISYDNVNKYMYAKSLKLRQFSNLFVDEQQ